MKKKKVLSLALAAALVAGLISVPGSAQTNWPDMGPANVVEEDYFGMHRSTRDPNIRPNDILTLDSDNELLKRAFNKSVDYSYNELVVGPKQFPLSEKDQRITQHYAGTGYFTSTAVPAIWGTYHGKPGESYRECFCDRDISHTAEAGSLLALNEENYSMLNKFAEESADLYWRETSHFADENQRWNRKSDKQKWWPLWSMDFYGNAYYMDAAFQELPAPFEVMDKIWTQYRWTGDARWIDDTMINYGMNLHSYDKFMKLHDMDGDGLADNGTNKDILPTLYEYEASGYLQKEDVEFETMDEATGDATYPYETRLVIKPNFFQKHNFYELPLTMKLIGKNSNGSHSEQGENAYIVRLNNKEYDTSKPAVLKTFDQMSTRNNHSYFHDVEVPVYVPEGVTFEVYNAAEKIDAANYTVTDNEDGTKTITVKADYFRNTYRDVYKTNAGIVVRFSDGTSGMVTVKMDDNVVQGNLNVVQILKNGEDVTDSLEKDNTINTTYLDYEASELADTNYTFVIRHKDTIKPMITEWSKLADYCRITSDMTRVATAGDTVGTQYQALLAMANMVRARIAAGDTTFQPFHLEKGVKVNDGDPITLTEDMAKEYEDRAAGIRKVIETQWRDDNSPEVYARAINKLGERDTDWGHENSFFMPMKELLNPGQDTINYLNFIQKHALLDSALNEEAITYMPESFYMHGQNVAGWQWTKVGLNRLDPAQKDEQTIVKTYPEIALMNVFNVAGLMMGIEPYAADDTVTTLPRLTSEVGWAEVKNVPLGQTGRDVLEMNGLDSDGNPRASSYGKPNVTNKFDLKHVGTTQSTLTNTGKKEITWNAEFYGNYKELYQIEEDGTVTPITKVTHKDIAPESTYCTVTVKPGESVTIATQPDPNASKPNTTGEIYLSDQDTAYENVPEGKAVQKDQTIGGTALYDYTYTKQYAKGLGVQPDTTVRYYLPEGATKFQAVPTITDFQRNTNPADSNAVVEARVYVDDELKQTVTLDKTNGLTGEMLDIDVTGGSVLDLVVINRGQYMRESAAWLDAKILVEGVDEFPSTLPENKLYLTDMQSANESGTVTFDQSANDGTGLVIDKHAFRKGISSRGNSEVTYELGGLYKTLDAVLGTQNGNGTSATYKVYLNDDAEPAFTETINGGTDVKHVTIDLKSADKVRIVTESGDAANWADMILTVGDGVDLTDPAIIAKRINDVEDIKLGQKKYNLPEIPSSNPDDYTIEIASSSDENVLAKDGTITLDKDEHNIAVTFKITEKDGAKRSAETRTFIVYAPSKDRVLLTKLDWVDAISTNKQITVNKDVDGKKLKVDTTEYENGFGMCAAGESQLTYDLEGGAYKRFTATVGYAQNSGWNNNDFFRVFVYAVDANGERTELYESPVFVKGPFENNPHKDCPNCKPVIDQYGYATSDKIDVDIPAGNEQLVIRTERIGDSFWGSCAVVDPYFYLNSPYEGKEIASFEPVSVQTVQNVAPVLPKMVKAKYDGVDALRQMKVKWDAIDESQYAQPGTFKVLGTVDGTDLRPECTVVVKDKIIQSAENASVVTTLGNKPELPATVKVVYNDNSTGQEAVTWDEMNEADWAKEGSFTVNGIVDGTNIKVICRVRVDDPNKVLLSNVEPEYKSAPYGFEINSFEINGKRYDNSIFAHADSELIYDLGGAYTRFTTTVGIKSQMGNPNPNVTFRGYGIDADGNETLLYDTNAVTKVVDPNADPRTADANGYYYVGGEVSYDVDVDVTGFAKLKLVADTVGNPNTDHSTYGTPILYSAGSAMGQGFHTVTVTSGKGGAIWPNGQVIVPDGEDVVFTVTPNPANDKGVTVKGMEVDQFKVDGADTALTGNTFTLNKVDADHTISVNFKEEGSAEVERYNVTVENGSGDGEWAVGEDVTITANAAPEGQVFDKWTTENGVTFADANAATTTFKMPAKDVTVTATYKEKPFDKSLLTNLYYSSFSVIYQEKAYTPETWKPFKEAHDAAGVVVMDQNATEAQAKEAYNNLKAAYDALEKMPKPDTDKSRLQGLVDQAYDVNYYDYTDESYAEMMTVAGQAERVLYDDYATQEEVDAAAEALKTAIDNLVPIGGEAVDKSQLQAVYDEVKDKTQDNYTDESWGAFINALSQAQSVLGRDSATQEEVDAALQALNDAVAGLEEKIVIDTSELQKAFDQYNNIANDNYTSESWAEFQNALNHASDLLKNGASSQEEVNEATDALHQAYGNLAKKVIDKSKLQKLVDKSKKYENKIDEYTTATAESFTDALAHARAVLDEDVTQEEFDAAYAALQNAVFQLRLIPNKDKLGDLINKAEKVDTSKYTAESAEVFTTALDNAKVVFADENATAEDVKAAEKDLKAAQKSLVPLKGNGNGKPKADETASVAGWMTTVLMGVGAADVSK